MTDPCASLVERGDRDRFAATMAAPATARVRLWPIYAFNLEVARSAWASSEPLVAEMRLQWWRDSLAAIDARTETQQHEVLGPLAGVIRERGLPVALFDGVIAARQWDVWHAPFADSTAFEAHLQATAGNLMWLAALALGAGQDAEPVVRNFAFGAGLAGWLQAVPDLKARGRLPLVDGRDEAVAALAHLGLARIAVARASRRQVARSASPALLAGWQASGLLAQIAREPGRVASGATGLSEFARRGSLLWRGTFGLW